MPCFVEFGFSSLHLGIKQKPSFCRVHGYVETLGYASLELAADC